MSDEKVDLDYIRTEQVALIEQALELQTETNGEKLMEKSKALRMRAQQFSIKCKVFEAQEKSRWPEAQKGQVVVKLTPDQRQRIGAATGYDMEEYVFKNAGLTTNRMMESMLPAQIEFLAMKEARRLQLEKQSKIEGKIQIENQLAILENIDNKDFQKFLAEAKRDPNFLGGQLSDD